MIDSLELAVRQWAEDKGIFEKSTGLAQMEKMEEEVDELFTEVALEAHNGLDDTSGIKDELGDVLVTAVIQAHFHGLSLSSCLAEAYNKISKRTGRMEKGVFVKDE